MKALGALTGACGIAAAIVIGFGSDARAQGGCLPGDTPVTIPGTSYSPSQVTMKKRAAVTVLQVIEAYLAYAKGRQ